MTDAKSRIKILHTETEGVSHKQTRALLTRRKLVASARKIFARDGFEQARIEDIAKLAGRTRGAFYANFKDKEDVFFAIFEEDIAYDTSQIRPRLRELKTADQRVGALCDYLVEMSRNRQRTLLHLEFKLYAIRHPRKRKRLADLHAAMRLRCSLPELNELLPEFDGQTTEKRRAASLTISAFLDGLSFNRLFDPGVLDDSALAQYLRLCVREVLQLGSSKTRGHLRRAIA